MVAGAEIDGRALAQAVFVLRGKADVVEIDIFFTGSRRFALAVDIVGANRQVAVADRNDRAEVEAVALGTLVEISVEIVFQGTTSVIGDVTEHVETGDAAGRKALEILGHDEGLGEAAVVVAAEVDDVAVFTAGVLTEGLVVLEFVGQNRVQGAEVARKSRGSVAVDGGGAFTVRVGAGFIEGVLDRSLQTGELRGLVRDHVVVAVGLGKAENATRAAVEGVGVAVDEVEAGAGTNAADAAHGERTEVGGEGDGGLTVKELAFGLEFAGVSLEAVFELEAHLHAVAEVFRTLDAEAGSGVQTVFHGERVGINHGLVEDGDFVGLVLEARVDLAVHRNFSGLNGESGSAENGDSDKRLLEHNLVIQIKGKIWGSSSKTPVPKPN